MHEENYQWIAGVDEAGRGPLAGPVCAAAVILDPQKPIAGIGDSKTLSPKRRTQLNQIIRNQAHAWAIAWASASEIDQLNILQASLLAMQRALEALSVKPDYVFIDGTFCPKFSVEMQAVIGGDRKILAIGAASILAKVARDHKMEQLDQEYPGYGFKTHKGYPTQAHLIALQQLGPCPEHRRSFAPVRAQAGFLRS